MSFIFGGDTGLTYEDIQRKRKVADQMLAANARTPRNVGEGLHAIGRALAARAIEKRTEKRDAELRDQFNQDYASAFAPTTPPVTAPVGDVEVSPLPGGDSGEDWSRDAVWKALINQESGGNPNAVSPKGAVGLTQIMPDTARDPGYGVPNIFDIAGRMGVPVPDQSDATLESLLRNEAVNEKFGSLYFDAMSRENGGDLRKTLAAYNAGPGAVEEYGGVPPYAETQNYVKAITGAVQPSQPQPQPQSQPQALAQGPAGGNLQQLAALLGNPYASEGQKAVLQAMIGQAVQGQEQMTPYQQAQLDLQSRRLDAQLSGKLKTGTTVNVGGNGINYGNPPKDMAWARSADGSVKLDERGVPVALPIINTKRAEEIEKTETAAAKRGESTQQTAALQTEEIGRAKKLIEASPMLTTGFIGSMMANVGGTGAADLSALLDTIGANISFDYLNQMRQQSPTGGALGNITERELDLLRATAGNLRQSQSAEQLLENLERLELQFGKIIHGPDWKPAPPPPDDELDGYQIRVVE